MPYTPPPIIQELTNYRRLHHKTQQEMAEIIGCSVEALSRWEQGRSRPGRLARTCIMRSLQLPLKFAQGDEA
ncbi:hypothetical protein ES703_49171 [subsurface metagenome]